MATKKFGFKERGTGSFGFKLDEDGDAKLGNSSNDLIEVTGTLDVNGDVKADKVYTAELYSTDGNREIVIASGDTAILNDLRAGINNNPDTLVVDRSEDKVAVGKNLPLSSDAHIFEVFGDISASVNISGSGFYGDVFADNIYASNDIVFSDNNGTFPTTTPGFYWDLNNDEARMYARQPGSDQIDFVFKLSDNNHSYDRFMFWIDDYRGGSYDRYPLMMHGDGVFFQMTETSEGVPNTATSRARIDSQGRLGLNCDGTTDPSTVVNHAHIYSKLVSGHAEMFVRDSNGNVTQISPHTPEGEWQYFSKNVKTGKVVRVNMEKMIKRLEQITGESFLEEWFEEPEI